MKPELLDILRCPVSGQPLELVGASTSNGEIEHGRLVTTDGAHIYPIIDFVPRFVPAGNYAASFGFQWKKFRRTQLDSVTGVPISRDRLLGTIGWEAADFAGKRILEVGCGAGRFSEVLLELGGRLVALDYSLAIDACWLNHKHQPGFHAVQGDIYHLPFKPESFDLVLCLGVLQHTPEVKKAFMALIPCLCRGGTLAIDVYPKSILNLFLPRYWVRPLSKRRPPQKLFRMVEFMVRLLLPVSVALGRVPKVGRKLRHLIPVANYQGVYPLSPAQLKEWALLDTFDMLSPVFDQPQTLQEINKWFQEGGFKKVTCARKGVIVARGEKI